MKIALIGYGRMGRAIEEIALQRGHSIVAVIDIDNLADFDSESFASADVAIEFTNGSQAEENIRKCWEKGIPVVSGTTGWLGDEVYRELHRMAKEMNVSLLHSSNFSVGVNLLFAVNRYLAKLISPFPDYEASIEEAHHVHKKDHPSGTAITLAQGIIESNPEYEEWKEESERDDVRKPLIPVLCRREGENPGFHKVEWKSTTDVISISHQAFNRNGFALGAVLGAEWIVGQPKGKIYSTRDMFKF